MKTMTNSDVEAALENLATQTTPKSSEQDVQRAVVSTQSRLLDFQKHLKRATPKTVVYSVGASYNSYESRWKYDLLDLIGNGNNVTMLRGPKNDKDVQLTGDPYSIAVTTRAYESVREWMRTDTHRALLAANHAGEVENSYAWYTTYRGRLVKSMALRITPHNGHQPINTELRQPEVLVLHGAQDSRHSVGTITLEGKTFDLISRG